MTAELNSLGIAKSPKDTRVVVAMSGGVDSSVVAALLHEEGYDVVGVTLQLYDHGAAVSAGGVVRSKTCCAGQDIYDARRVAEAHGFPHYVLNYESNFRESVIDDFADSYLRGETPIPCVKCNQTVKFRDLLAVARDLGADCMATGHYIQRTIDENGKAHLLRAHDDGKDQSYFLFATTQEQLDFLRFPLGGWSKSITREHAQRLGLLNAEKPDSQDICFVPNGDYAKIVKKIRPEAEKSGDIVHMDGRIIGTHDGIIHYTIGQRKGLGIGGGVTENNEPLYVIALNPANNQVIVGSKESLARDTLVLQNCNWLFDNVNLREAKGCPYLPVTVKFRSTMAPAPARLNTETNEIILETPQYGISAGQAAVCYIGNNMIGGGWISYTKLTTKKTA
jgi:tRNA-uridine 2-sulfurtransferase